MATNKTKLNKLRKHIDNGGDTGESTLVTLLSIDPADCAEYMAAVAPPAEFKIYLKEDGLLVELEKEKETDTKIILIKKVPKLLVSVTVGGRPTVVDLLALQRDPSGTTNGVANATLIIAAEIARS